MAEEVKLPELGESVTEAIVTAWLVEVGDTVEVDQPLFEISTDKVDTEVPSPVAGTLLERKAEVDDTIEPGQVIAIIGEGDDDAPADADPDTEEQPQAEAEPETDDEPDAEEAEGDEELTAEAEPETEAEPEAEAKPEAEAEPDAEPEADGEPAQEVGGGDTYDVLILGAGTGGYSCALRAAQLGLKVALVDRDKVGGTCLHRGCIPTKALLQSAEIAEHAQEAGEFGVKVDYLGIEVAKVNEHKQSVVDKMHKGLQGALSARGVETFHGTGRLTGKDTIEVETEEGTRTLTGRNVVLATGSEPREMPFAPFDGERIISSDHALELEEIPDSVLILGAGAIGMEFASAWHAFGAEVTIVELEDRLLPLEDPDVSKEIGRQFRKAGINALTAAKMTAVETTDTGVRATVETGKGEETLEADLLLVAVGRAPVTEGSGIDEIGVETDRGFVVVDGYSRTNIDGIWALGDVIPTLMLAHASFAEGFLVADQLGGLDVLPIDYKGVPRVTYCHPEVASVGLTEPEAEEAGHDIQVEKYPFQALGRAAMMKASGMIKIVAAKDGPVLGVHIVGPRATDLISEAELIYNWEALPLDVARFIHPHPSLGEAMGEAHLALAGRALHG